MDEINERVARAQKYLDKKAKERQDNRITLFWVIIAVLTVFLGFFSKQ